MTYWFIGSIVLLVALVWLARRAIDFAAGGRDPREREAGGLWYGVGSAVGPHSGDASGATGFASGGDVGGGGDCGGGGGG